MANEDKQYLIIRGNPARRTVGHTTEILTPTCYYDAGFFKLALADEGDSHYFCKGDSRESRLISAFRSVKIAECIYNFNDGGVKNFLDSCMIAGRYDDKIAKELMPRVRMIERAIGKNKRKEILNLVPANLDRIVEMLEEGRINYYRRELMEEFQGKRIDYTHVVSRVIDDVVADIVRMKR